APAAACWVRVAITRSRTSTPSHHPFKPTSGSAARSRLRTSTSSTLTGTFGGAASPSSCCVGCWARAALIRARSVSLRSWRSSRARSASSCSMRAWSARQSVARWRNSAALTGRPWAALWSATLSRKSGPVRRSLLLIVDLQGGCGAGRFVAGPGAPERAVGGFDAGEELGGAEALDLSAARLELGDVGGDALAGGALPFWHPVQRTGHWRWAHRRARAGDRRDGRSHFGGRRWGHAAGHVAHPRCLGLRARLRLRSPGGLRPGRLRGSGAPLLGGGSLPSALELGLPGFPRRKEIGQRLIRGLLRERVAGEPAVLGAGDVALLEQGGQARGHARGRGAGVHLGADL